MTASSTTTAKVNEAADATASSSTTTLGSAGPDFLVSDNSGSVPKTTAATLDPTSSTTEQDKQQQPVIVQVEESKPAARDWKKEIWAFIVKHWFLEGLAFAIAFAAIWPDLGKTHGYIRAEYTVSYGCVMMIFILSGMSLKTKVLVQSLANWKMHLVIQLLSLGVTPAIGLAVGKLLGLSATFNSTLAKGLIIACSTPTTISSNVLMTKQAGGDEAGALTNAVIGNILGVFISPSLIFAYVGALGSSSLDYGHTFQTLAITVIGPLIVGQLLQYFFPALVPTLSKYVNLAILNSSFLLVLVWNVFCNTFSEHLGDGIDAGSMVAIFVLDLVLFVGFSLLAFGVSRVPLLRFSRESTVAIVMCAATKTVALGIPMINIIYAGSPLIGIISTPLLVYHAEQLVVGAFLVTWFKNWIERGKALDQEQQSSHDGEGVVELAVRV
ncbi:SBF-like CPA transporter family-domain-containing protein [Obelidium mucronatum]|nr:SBF-like CPA transporter family-domain-containing protein [Obelidium mucronatum]